MRALEVVPEADDTRREADRGTCTEVPRTRAPGTLAPTRPAEPLRASRVPAASRRSESVSGPRAWHGIVLTAAAPKRAHHGPDKHTKGPRADRPELTSGGHKARGGASRTPRTPAFGGERRQFERRSGANPDSQKKVDQGWGSNEGTAELTGALGRMYHARVKLIASRGPGREGRPGRGGCPRHARR